MLHYKEYIKHLSKVSMSLTGVFYICLWLSPKIIAQQQSVRLQINTPKSAEVFSVDSIPMLYQDSISLYQKLLLWQKKAFEKSYFEASIDSLVKKDTSFVATLHLGKPYRWLNVSMGNIDPYLLEKVGFRQKKFGEKKIQAADGQIFGEKIISFLENNGYPFAQLYLDGVEINDANVSGYWHLNKGRKIFFDGIAFENDSQQVSKNYLQLYLGIHSKKVYNQQLIKNIKRRVQELPFLTLEGEPYPVFKGERATIKMLVKKRKASRFDAVLGLLPSDNPNGDSRKFVISGTFNLDLQNTFERGERLLIDFQRLRLETQEFKAQATYPYILNFNVGADAGLTIFKSESFVEIRSNVGLQYLYSGNNSLKIYWTKNQTNLSTIDSLLLYTMRRLPEQLDVDGNAYGVEINLQNLDYRFNPRKGLSFNLKSDMGVRIIKKNNTILNFKDSNDPAFSFSSLYDTLALRSFRFQTQGNLAFYVPIRKQSTLKMGVQGAAMFTPEKIYQNEQYRIGGNRLLRGFDEGALLATHFAIMTLEYRYLFGQNAYLSLFGDAAYINNRTTRIQDTSYPMSVGAGMTFETRAGLFSLLYALGKPDRSSFQIKNGKIHFGYVNLF
jgi:hypothetical protein